MTLDKIRRDRLPNFFIIGAAKAGTTSLYQYLRVHPEIFLSEVKEPQYFCNDYEYEKGIDYYVDTFFRGAEMMQARGEATPHYLFYEKAARRMAEILPETHQRFIVILRDPVERAYSLYNNMVHEGNESLSFEGAIDAEEHRTDNEEMYRQGQVHFQYISSGMYARQLRAYFRYFDSDRFLILFQEDLRDRPQELLKSVYDFLGIADLKPMDKDLGVSYNTAARPRLRWLQDWLRQPSNIKRQLGRLLPRPVKYKLVTALLAVNRRKFNYKPLSLEMDTVLRKVFRDDIIDLEGITGRNLREWKEGRQGSGKESKCGVGKRK